MSGTVLGNGTHKEKSRNLEPMGGDRYETSNYIDNHSSNYIFTPSSLKRNSTQSSS